MIYEEARRAVWEDVTVPKEVTLKNGRRYRLKPGYYHHMLTEEILGLLDRRGVPVFIRLGNIDRIRDLPRRRRRRAGA